jgi:hypothetical protein
VTWWDKQLSKSGRLLDIVVSGKSFTSRDP